MAAPRRSGALLLRAAMAGSGSLSAVDSGMRSTQWGDGGLGTGSGVTGSKICSRTIFGQWFFALWVQAGIVECAERVIQVAGDISKDQEQSCMVLEQSFPLLQQKEEEFRAGERIHGENTT